MLSKKHGVLNSVKPHQIWQRIEGSYCLSRSQQRHQSNDILSIFPRSLTEKEKTAILKGQKAVLFQLGPFNDWEEGRGPGWQGWRGAWPWRQQCPQPGPLPLPCPSCPRPPSKEGGTNGGASEAGEKREAVGKRRRLGLLATAWLTFYNITMTAGWLVLPIVLIWKKEHTKVYMEVFRRHLNFSRHSSCLR